MAIPQTTSTPYPGITSSFTGGERQLLPRDKELYKKECVYTSDKIDALVSRITILETSKGGLSLTAYFYTSKIEDLTHYFKQNGIPLKLEKIIEGRYMHTANSAQDAMDFYLVIKNANNVSSEIDQEIKRILLRPRL